MEGRGREGGKKKWSEVRAGGKGSAVEGEGGRRVEVK